MDRRVGYGKRRGILPRPRPLQGSSPNSTRRREHAESSSGNDEREASEGLRESSTERSAQAQQKPTVILMKPRSRKNEEEEEEWPTVGKPVAIVPSRTTTPVRRAESSGMATAASASVASASAVEDSSYERSEWSGSGSRGFRRPLLLNTSSSSAAQPASATSYQIQQKPPASFTDAGLREPSSMGAKTLRAGVRLITEGMEWSETALDYLQDQTNFLVVGILGPQGVGKSTLLSMIGGNDPFDMYRQYIFRPASKECTETGGRQTSGVQIYVNDSRIILLDAQPILSHAIMEQINQSDHRYNYEYRMTENCMEVESLQIACFLMQVCHVVIFLVDWFVDVNLLRFVQTAEMLKPSAPISENPEGGDHYPHFVFVQNRARREDYTLLSIKSKCKFLDKMFEKSALHLKDGVSLKNSSYDTYEELGEECGAVNLFLLPDMKPRGYKAEALTSYKGIPDFEILVRDLRNQIWSLPRSSFGQNILTEKNWFHLAARTWDMTRKSLLISEYGRMLP